MTDHPEISRTYGRGVRTFTAGREADAPATTEPLVAAGGWCAPVAPCYDFYDLVRRPWRYPDRPWARDVNVDRWLFPRLTRWAKAFSEARRRLGLAVAALRPPQVVEVDDDEW